MSRQLFDPTLSAFGLIAMSMDTSDGGEDTPEEPVMIEGGKVRS